jgi:NADH-quinone oxidoreductase subunit J
LPGDAILFYVFGAVTIVASLLVVGQRSPIYSVLLLIVSFGALAGLYVLLDAPFLAVVQIIIYAGAIMVLFLFVVMLLNAPYEKVPADLQRRWPAHGPRRAGAVLGLALLVELAWSLWRAGGAQETQAAFSSARNAQAVTSVRNIGHVLFAEYGFAFEVTSVLILVAMVGAVVLAKREI